MGNDRQAAMADVTTAYKQWLNNHPQSAAAGTRGWRQTCVWKAAELLSLRLGRVTTDSVYELTGFGSKTDIARDIDQWRQDDLRRRNWIARIEPLLLLPQVQDSFARALEEITSVLRTEAASLALAELDGQREELAQHAQRLQGEHSAISAELEQLREHERSSSEAAAKAQQAQAQLQDRLDIALTQVQGLNDALAAERAAARERESALRRQVTDTAEELRKAAVQLEGMNRRMLLDIEEERRQKGLALEQLETTKEALQGALMRAATAEARSSDSEAMQDQLKAQLKDATLHAAELEKHVALQASEVTHAAQAQLVWLRTNVGAILHAAASSPDQFAQDFAAIERFELDAGAPLAFSLTAKGGLLSPALPDATAAFVWAKARTIAEATSQKPAAAKRTGKNERDQLHSSSASKGSATTDRKSTEAGVHRPANPRKSKT